MTDRFDEAARELQSNHCKPVCNLEPCRCCDAVAQALRDTHNAALEEAFDVIDEIAKKFGAGPAAMMMIASTIEARKMKP